MTDELAPDELEALRCITTPTVANAIETFRVRPRNEGFMSSAIRCIFPELGTLVGYACTATIRASERRPDDAPRPWDFWEVVQKLPAPRVVVIQDLDYPAVVGSYWGEVNANLYRALGCAGVVTDGGVRDLDEVRSLGFHCFASCVLVSHAYVHLLEVGAPVTVGGLTISPGDLLHADQHGVLTIPKEIAREVPRAASEVEQRERPIIDFCKRPDFSPEKLRQLFERGY